MVEYRPVPEERHDEFHQLVDYAFRPQEGPQQYDDDDLPARHGDVRAVFDDETPLSGCILQEFDARLRGKWVTLGGYTAVVTPPEHRRQGYVERLLRDSLDEYRDRDVSFVALWPFKRSFYRQFGWETTTRYARCEVEPAALSFAREQVTGSGEFWQATPDDWRAVHEVHLADGEGKTLSVERTEEWWRTRIFERFGDERYVYAWDDERGETHGYVVYDFEGEGSSRTLHARELLARSEEAYLQLLRFLYRHSSQVSTVELVQGPEVDLLERVADTRDVECAVDAGPMIRVADVASALVDVPYPAGATGRLTIAVTDPLLDENDGTVELTVEDGQAAAEYVSDGREADIEAGVGTLSQVLVGYHDVVDAERLGSLSVADEHTRATLGRLFPPETVRLGEFF